MAARKTQYSVNLNADIQIVNGVILEWLSANGFQYMEKDGFKFYRSGDNMMTSARFFEYYFQGNQLLIYAYLKSPKKPFPLDNGMVGALQTTPYVNLISELISAINNLPVASGQAGNVQYQTNQTVQYQQVGTQNAFQEQADKRNKNSAIGALALGILNFLLAFGGLKLGVFVVVVAYVLAIQGLKAKQKGIAIAALAVITLSLVLDILIMTGAVIL